MSFFSLEEQSVVDSFLRDGYVIAPVEDRAALDKIRAFVAEQTASFLGVAKPENEQQFLDTIGSALPQAALNAARLHVIDAILATPWFHAAYFGCARQLLQTLVGNELAMQRGLGFSIQLPGDTSSVLPLHSDVWSEDSPFEVVLWIPLVDCSGTKRMFLLPPQANDRWKERVHEFQARGVEELFHELEPDLAWLDIQYGQVLVFTHTLMHGNRLNTETTARWSMNVRFKGLFTPYADKRLGDFFIPICVRPASRIGMDYQLPAGFDG